MTSNRVLQELYAARAQIMSKYGNNLGAYLRDAAERTKASGHPVAQIKQRTIRCTGAAKSRGSTLENQSSPPRDR